MFKSIAITLILGMLTFIPVQTYGQTQKEVAKERKQINKLSQAELEKKVSKIVRKEAKKLEKEGWKVQGSDLPLEKQLERAYLMQYEYDENNNRKYITGVGLSTGQYYNPVRMAARQAATAELVELIQSEVKGEIDNRFMNGELENGERVSATEAVEVFQTLLEKKLEKAELIFAIYREKNNIQEVLIRLAYNSEQAMSNGKEATIQTLRERGNELAKKLEKLWDK
jgi:Asp-tRNA(Asn)/Glu-tRNA(Gln) amidotransferase A subunit family amidase